jgi:hypothetical protein
VKSQAAEHMLKAVVECIAFHRAEAMHTIRIKTFVIKNTKEVTKTAAIV